MTVQLVTLIVYLVVLSWHACVAAIMFGVLILRAFEQDAA